MNPKRSRVAKTFDPDDVAGIQYDMMQRTMLVTATSSATVNLWEIPAGTLIREVIVHMDSLLDAGEVEVGIDANLDEFIDSNDWDPTSDVLLVSGASATADSPNGKFVASGGTLVLTISGSTTGGTLRILVRYMLFDDIFEGADYGANAEYDAP